jgi:hypothetical protein
MGALRLYRHRVGYRPQCRHIDGLSRYVGCNDLRDRFAAPRDAHRISRSGLLDQLAQMRLRVGEIDRSYFTLLTKNVVTLSPGTSQHNTSRGRDDHSIGRNIMAPRLLTKRSVISRAGGALRKPPINSVP